ncbi:uncharacterized protein EAE97_005411 [Botrytis byssoidea]|uniref:FAD-binding PCMH-type domain-containing protein n=1 Tax=Botrytis byssoidea TaxID=139641 RepID=A0A9P5M5T6_9HELO|nr:uncharacterized protein EAE97_005411 [Botrytis byssoidea]KAF7944778.1 hypothetical protein EAE97_005411 [Botrytis byssoidea]
MAWTFTNNTCNPFLSDTTSCALGNYISYTVNATTTDDVNAAVTFANLFNIRLVIRATGHEYNGKSTGAGALVIWIHHLTSISLFETYNFSVYTEKAVVVGSGVSFQQAYEFVDANNDIIVAGNRSTVALAGGYGQGGGLGPLTTKFGLTVDQVLEWQVVIGLGILVIYCSVRNYEISSKVTSISSASLQFAPPITTEGLAAYWQTVKRFLQSLPLMVDSGLQIVWIIGPGFSFISPVTGLDVAQDTIDSLFPPTLSALDKAEIPYTYTSSVSSLFLEYQNSTNFDANVSNASTAGRLLPRSVVQNDTDSFISVLQTSVDNNSQHPEISINPYWRKTLMNVVFDTYRNYTDFSANFQSQNFMTNTIGPAIAALTPDGSVYLNEADVQQPDWKRAFYGANYDRLDAIKTNYDSLDRFYALGALKSDRWVERKDGHLCEA